MRIKDPYRFRRVFINLFFPPCFIAWTVVALLAGFGGWPAVIVGFALGAVSAYLLGSTGYRLLCTFIVWLDRRAGND